MLPESNVAAGTSAGRLVRRKLVAETGGQVLSRLLPRGPSLHCLEGGMEQKASCKRQ